jgi:hypothetical protein
MSLGHPSQTASRPSDHGTDRDPLSGTAQDDRRHRTLRLPAGPGALGRLTAATGLVAIALTGGLAPAQAAGATVGTRYADSVANAAPFGNVEQVTSTAGAISVVGWALDPDTTSPIAVHVYVDTAGRAVTASISRPDVGAAFGHGNLHGYATTIPAAPGGHTVCVYAINTPAGDNPTLGCRTVTVANAAPFGYVDSVTTTASSIAVAGWALDPDTTSPIAVHVYVDVTGTAVTADLSRPDVAAAFGDGDLHGYATTIAAGPGDHNVCVYAINTPAGDNPSLGCRIVTVISTVTTPTGLAPGTYKPGASNTGVPTGTHLTVHNGDLTITAAGTVINGLDIHGFVTVKALGVTIKNSIIRGTATSVQRALLLSAANTASVTIQDSELVAAYPSVWIDGIRGWNITANRLNIHNVVDSLHLYGNNITVQSCWLHDNSYFTVDPNHSGGPTHNDNIQIQVGTNIRVTGNNMSGARNSAMQFTQDSGLVSNVQVVHNWLDGGACTINVAEKGKGPFKGLVMTDNTFGRASTIANCPIIAPTTTVISVARNFFTDGAVAAVHKG